MLWCCSVDGVQDLERLKVVCAPDHDWVLLVLMLVGEERMGGLTALSRANADFSSATIRLWRVSNNSLLGTSVMSLCKVVRVLCVLLQTAKYC